MRINKQLAVLGLAFGVAASASAKFEEFTHPSPNNNGLYIYVQGPAALLDTHVPTNVANAYKIDYVDGEAVTNGTKTVVEYLTLAPVYSVYSNSVIILLNEKYDPRINGVNEANIAKWDAVLSAYGLGYDSGGWMGLDGSACTNKVSALLNSSAYYRGNP